MPQNQLPRFVILAALLTLTIQCGWVQGAVAYDNLGSAPYNAVGYATFGLYSDGIYYDRGMQFTAVQTVTLTTLQLAMGEAFFPSGNSAQPGTARIQLMTDSSDTPGAVMESWTSATISGNPSTGGVLDFNSALTPKLTAGSKYWLVLSAAPGSNLGGAWFFADDSHTGNTLTLWRNDNTGTPTYATLTRGYRARVSGDIIMPKLEISRSSNSVKISWTANATGGTLQRASSLNPGSAWTNIGTGTIVSNQYVVTEPISATPNWYRLVR